MLQTVQGRQVYVVNLYTVPELPITWMTAEEKPYAEALGSAIRKGIIDEPGQYGIDIHPDDTELDYYVYQLQSYE